MIAVVIGAALGLSTLINSVFAAKRGKPVAFGKLPIPAGLLAADAHRSEGLISAKVAVIVFSDFECPECAHFATQSLPTLRRDYVLSGKARIVFRHYPLENLHPNAIPAAVLAECASQVGEFWKAHDLLFRQSGQLDSVNLGNLADTAGVGTVYRACSIDKKETIVRRQVAEGRALQVSATPTFFVGLNGPDGIRVLERRSGSGLAPLKAMIDSALQQSQR